MSLSCELDFLYTSNCPSQWPHSLWGAHNLRLDSVSAILVDRIQQRHLGDRYRKWRNSLRDWDTDSPQLLSALVKLWQSKLWGLNTRRLGLHVSSYVGVLGIAVMWWHFHHRSKYTSWSQEIWTLRKRKINGSVTLTGCKLSSIKASHTGCWCKTVFVSCEKG